MKVTKFGTGILVIFSIIIFIFLYSKENPRIYLNSGNYNTIYANENIFNKNIEPLLEILKKTEYRDKISKDIISKIKNIYFLTNSNPKLQKDWVCVIDFGYIYPMILSKIDRCFSKSGSYYVLKDDFKRKIKKEEVYLEIDHGNFIFSNSVENIRRFIKKENYLNENMIKVFEREKRKNLGIIMINLEKNPLSGIDEIVITGDMKENGNIQIFGSIKGESDIIKGFNQIADDDESGERILNKNIIYLRCQNKNIKPFLFFINYFLGEGFSDKIFCRMNKLKKEYLNTVVVKIEKNQFLYGYLEKNKGIIEIKGKAFNNRLEVVSNIDNEIFNDVFKKRGREKR